MQPPHSLIVFTRLQYSWQCGRTLWMMMRFAVNIEGFKSCWRMCKHFITLREALLLVANAFFIFFEESIDGVTCIRCKFDHRTAPLALVANLTTRWRHLHLLQILLPFVLVANFSTRWRHLNSFQIWPTSDHQVSPPYLIFVIFSPRAQFFAKFFSTQKRVNRTKTDFATKQRKLQKNWFGNRIL